MRLKLLSLCSDLLSETFFFPNPAKHSLSFIQNPNPLLVCRLCSNQSQIPICALMREKENRMLTLKSHLRPLSQHSMMWHTTNEMRWNETTLFRAVSFTTFPFTLKQIVFPIIQWYFRPFCITMLNATWVILWRGLSKPRYYKLLCMKKWLRLRWPYETEREQVRQIEHPVEEYDAMGTCNEATDVRIWASDVRCSHVKSLQNGASM